MSDTFLRYLLILQWLPRAPRRTDCATLASRLEQLGLGVTRRTLQRDLEKLSRVLPIECSDGTKPYRWSLGEGSSFPLSGLAGVLGRQQVPGPVPRSLAVLDLLDQWRELETGCFEAGLAPFVALYLCDVVAAHTGLELSKAVVPLPPDVEFALSTRDQQTALVVRLCAHPRVSDGVQSSGADLKRRVALALGAPRPRLRLLFLEPEPNSEPGRDVIGFDELASVVERDHDEVSHCLARYLRQWAEHDCPKAVEAKTKGADVIPFVARAHRS